MLLFQCGESAKMSFLADSLTWFFLLDVLCWFVALYFWDIGFLLFINLTPERKITKPCVIELMCKSVKETNSELLIRVSARFPIPFAAQLFIILVLVFFQMQQ